MHSLANFRLDHSSSSNDQAAKRLEAASRIVETWLSGKGVPTPFADKGEFDSKTKGQRGRYMRNLIANDEGTIEETVLAEPAQTGHIFTTRIALVQCGRDTHVFCSLSIQASTTVVAPIQVFPRCPAVLKDIAKEVGGWRIGLDVVPTELQRTSAEELIVDILSFERCVPIVVVSEIEGDTIWPRLAEEVAFDLICLARVYRVSTEVSWALTERLGKADSCYLGAVRLYWPRRSSFEEAGSLYSHLWTASQLLSKDTDGKGVQRFRTVLRNLVLSVSARTVEPPTALRTILFHARQAKLLELEKKAESKSEELVIARSYLDDNEKLQNRVVELEGEIASLQGRALAAEHALGQQKEAEEQADEPTEEGLPASGETRYYKKVHDHGGGDVMVRVNACGHNSWQPANKADKAKKGIEKLEGTRNWSQLNHCGSCNGGGMWRVKW
jgi:hypothetical protein